MDNEYFILANQEKLQPYLKSASCPVLLNAWKHHLRFLQAMIVWAVEEGEVVIGHHILQMGHNVTDVYTGHLTPLEISENIMSDLKAKKVLDYELYQHWLQQKDKNYRHLLLKDQSRWTLLLGNQQQYIHIHPARYSPHSFRVKTQMLKSALWVSYTIVKQQQVVADLRLINQVRKEKLQLCPVKSISTQYKLSRLIGLLLNREEGEKYRI